MVNFSTSNSNTPVRHDIITRRGDTFHRRFTFTQTPVGGETAPEDLTGSTFKLAVINKADARKRPVLLFENGDFTRGGTGEVSIDKTALEMSICPANYWYDLEQTYADGTVRTRLAGDFQIINDVTQ